MNILAARISLESFIHHIGHFQKYLGVRLINPEETTILLIYILITHAMTIWWSGRYRSLLNSAIDGQ
jgi:hypothetical protein